MISKTIQEMIMKGDIDPNTEENFFGSCIKAALLWMNGHITLAGRRVPHYIMNTGDEILYRELMNYAYTKGGAITDEDFVYSAVPRCIVTPGSITSQPDQLTQPYVRGVFEISRLGTVYEMSAETRRMPIQITLSLKYIVDSFTDSLMLTQSLMSQVLYIRTFKFAYMGETICCSLKFPESLGDERPQSLEFGDEGRFKTLSFDLELDANIPICGGRTGVSTDRIITKVDNNIGSEVKREDYVAKKYPIDQAVVPDAWPDGSDKVQVLPDYINKPDDCV